VLAFGMLGSSAPVTRARARDDEARDERQDLVHDRAHGRQVDGVRGHEDDDEPQVPLHDARDESRGVRLDLCASQEACDADTLRHRVDLDRAEAPAHEAGEGSGDDPAEHEDDEGAKDDRDRGEKCGDPGREAGQ